MKFLYALLLCSLFTTSYAQQSDSIVRVLLVDAHPDDESGMAATIYKITHELGGKVDLAVVTNGEAGYKYSLLANDIYGQHLTTEATGRKYLPNIRAKELKAGCRWVGIKNIHFLHQKDTYYTLDADSVLTHVWDTAKVKAKIRQLIKKNHYDFIFCLLPTNDTHGHHKGASILALETVKDLPEATRPLVLGVSVGSLVDTVNRVKFSGLEKYPVTAVKAGRYSFSTDRSVKFGFRNALTYRIVVNWLIAEHKSQGSMQTYMGRGDLENFWYFDINSPARKAEAEALFKRLRLSRPKL